MVDKLPAIETQASATNEKDCKVVYSAPAGLRLLSIRWNSRAMSEPNSREGYSLLQERSQIVTPSQVAVFQWESQPAHFPVCLLRWRLQVLPFIEAGRQ